jgi:hypothetical protein
MAYDAENLDDNWYISSSTSGQSKLCYPVRSLFMINLAASSYGRPRPLCIQIHCNSTRPFFLRPPSRSVHEVNLCF